MCTPESLRNRLISVLTTKPKKKDEYNKSHSIHKADSTTGSTNRGLKVEVAFSIFSLATLPHVLEGYLGCLTASGDGNISRSLSYVKM